MNKFFDENKTEVANAITALANAVHETSRSNGFWDLISVKSEEDVDACVYAVQGQKLALIHSEISEALDALRRGWAEDDKLPEYDGVTVELADAVIRILDFCAAYNLPIGHAIMDKGRFNQSREKRHGKQF